MPHLRARETFFVGNAKVTKGQLVNDNDPILKGKAHLFEPIDGDIAVPMVEQATAAPGERRRVRVPRGRRSIRTPTSKPKG